MPDINWLTLVLGLFGYALLGTLVSVPLYYVLHKLGALDSLEED